MKPRLLAEDLLGTLLTEPGLLLGLALSRPCLVGVVVAVLLGVHHQRPVQVGLRVRPDVTRVVHLSNKEKEQVNGERQDCAKCQLNAWHTVTLPSELHVTTSSPEKI